MKWPERLDFLRGNMTKIEPSFRHELMKEKYPDKPNGKGIPLTGLSNARPETKGIQEMVEKYMELLPIDYREYIEYDDPSLKLDGDWGH